MDAIGQLTVCLHRGKLVTVDGYRVGNRLISLLLVTSAYLALASALAASGSGRVIVDGNDTSVLKLEHALPPDYPPLAKAAHVQGDVTLAVTVDEDGEVSDIKVLGGHPLLVKAAMDAVSQWEYAKPAVAPVRFDMTVHFELPKAATGEPHRAATDKSAGQTPPLKLVKTVNPVYPQEAKQSRVQGDVVLSVTVEKNGKVLGIETASGPKELIRPALDAVSQWEYEPPAKAPVLATVTVSFSLADDPAVTFHTEVRAPSEDRDEFGYGVPRHLLNPPVPVYKPEPSCPPAAGEACRDGRVMIWITVGPEGKVTEATVAKPLDPIVDKAALETVRTWKFRPATEDGKPIPQKVLVDFRFRSLMPK